MNRFVRAPAAVSLVAILVACQAQPLFRGTGSATLELSTPADVTGEGSAVCLGDSATVVNSVAGELGHARWRDHPLTFNVYRVTAATDATPTPSPGAAERVEVFVGLVLTAGTPPGSSPPGWETTDSSRITPTIEDGGRSGRIEFADLEVVTEVVGGRPIDTTGWPETLSGSLAWECGKPQEVRPTLDPGALPSQ